MCETMDNAPVGIMEVDSEGRVISRNRCANLLLGLDEGEDLGDIGTALVHADDPDRGQTTLMHVLSGETALKVEMRNTLPDGTRKTLRIEGQPILDRASDRVCGALYAISDVSEYHRGYEAELAGQRDHLEHQVEQLKGELTVANERLRDAVQARGAFVIGMGHEMKNQLNSIIGFSGILQQGLAGPLTDEQARQVDMVYAAGQTLRALVDNVIELSKLEAGQMHILVEPFELLSLLDGIIASFETLTQERKTSLEFVAPSGAIPMHSDRAKIEQITRNLLSNAIKFAPGGRVFVEVEREEDGTSVILRVRDAGEGIAPEVMTHIFDEFVKYERGGSSETSGTGLGLAITRKLSEVLGGNVSARSHPGEGSTFTVILPVDLREDTSDYEA